MEVATSPPKARPLLGITLVVLATLTFALGDIVTKQLAMSQPVPVILAVRYLVSLALLTTVLGPSLGTRLWRTERRWLVWLRGLCLALGSMAMAIALRWMPVGETVAILYLSPLAVMLLAVPFLGERVGPAGWLGAAIGFIGVLLIVRPGGGLDAWGIVFALANAGLATVYHLLTRYLRSESTVAMLYQTALVSSLLFCLTSLGSLAGLALGSNELALMALLGLATTLGHYFFTAAYREAPASLLAPINYLHLAWAGGLGWLVFGQLPDVWGLMGMVLVFASGILIAATRRSRRDELATAVS